MLTSQNLYDIAKSRYDEARILLQSDKTDGAVYLCGYAMELILKQRIMKTLNWDGYPETDGEFKNLGSFKVHNLEMLLHLSGIEKVIQSNISIYSSWQIAKSWNSEMRYNQIGVLKKQDAENILDAVRDTVNYILRLK